MEKSKQQKNKVRFVVVREFSGVKSMREAFEQLIERQTCEHFEEWLEQRDYNGIVSLFIEGEHYEQEKTSL